MKTLILLATLLSVASLGRAVEAEPTASPEHINQLIKDLDGDDYDLRSSARIELHKLGEAAWPLVKKVPFHDELEFDEDIRELSYDMAIFDASQAQRAQVLFAQLDNPDELAKFNESCDALLEMGPAGVHALRKHLSGKGSMPSITINTEQTVFLVNQSYSIHAQLINEGQAPFWIPRTGLSPNLTMERETSFGENRDLQPSGQAAVARRSQQRINTTPLREFKPLMPNDNAGEPVNFQPTNGVTPTLGLYTIKATATLPQTILQGNLPNTDRTVELPLNSCFTADQRTITQTQRIYVVPDLAHFPEDPQLKLDLDPRASENDGCYGLRVVLSTLVKDQKLMLEEDLARYAWYLWLNEKGEPALWGSWYSVLANPKSDIALVSRCLFPKDRSAWELKLPEPVQAGTYTLVLGYDARPVDDEIARFYGTKNPNSQMPCVEFTGQVFSTVSKITVEGETENPELAPWP